MNLVLDQWIDLGQRPCSSVEVREISSAFAEPPMDGLFAWYKADAQTYNNDDRVVTMVDSGPNGYNLDGGGSGPLFKTNVLNGKPVFKYDIFRTNQVILAPSVNPPGFSSAIVTRRTDFDVISTGRVVSPVSAAGNLYVLRSFDSAPTSIRWEGTAGSTFPTLTVPGGSWQIVTFTYDDTEGIGRLKTNLLSATGAVSVASAGITAVFMQYWGNGEVAEVVDYAKKLSDTELNELRMYLSNKYAITII
jgi:hypothetical protein